LAGEGGEGCSADKMDDKESCASDQRKVRLRERRGR
jgi:hypothetical protein